MAVLTPKFGINISRSDTLKILLISRELTNI